MRRENIEYIVASFQKWNKVK